MSEGRRARGWRALVAWGIVEASAGGCVNTYVVDPPQSGSSGEADSGGATGDPDASGGDATISGSGTGTGSAEGSTGSEGTAGTTGDPPGDTGTATGTGTGTETGPLEACQPCTADAECGGDYDLCVLLDGEAVCLRVCAEGPRMCPIDQTCMPATSIEGAQGQQCVPDSGTCMPG